MKPDVPPFYDENEEEYERLYSASPVVIALLSLFYGCISFIAVLGNSLVIWVVATSRQMRTVTNMYIANLALADVIIGVFCIPFQFQAALLQRWNLPWFMCGFCTFVQALSVNVSVFTLTAIAVDRHRAIINPLRARPTMFASKAVLIGIWTLGIIFAIPCAIAFRVQLITEKVKENDEIFNITRPFCMNVNLTDNELQTYRYILVFVQYVIPFCVISFVYIQMAIKLWGTRAPGNAQDVRDLTLLKNKKKVIKMLIIVVVVFGFCWLPLQLYNMLHVTYPEINEYHFISIIWFCCDWLAMSNSCYNPFIYGIYNEKFKREFNKRFSTCLCKFKTKQDQPERTLSIHTRASSVRSTPQASSNRIKTTFLSRQPGSKLYESGNTQLLLNRNEPIQNIVTFIDDRNVNLNGKMGNSKDIDGHGTTEIIVKLNSYSGNDSKIISKGQGRNSWNQNSFKPSQPNLYECDDEDFHMSISSPFSDDPSGVTCNNSFQALMLENVSHESSTCICEQTLGRRFECDGTCILNDIARVQAPTETIKSNDDTISNNNMSLTEADYPFDLNGIPMITSSCGEEYEFYDLSSPCNTKKQAAKLSNVSDDTKSNFF